MKKKINKKLVIEGRIIKPPKLHNNPSCYLASYVLYSGSFDFSLKPSLKQVFMFKFTELEHDSI